MSHNSSCQPTRPVGGSSPERSKDYTLLGVVVPHVPRDTDHISTQRGVIVVVRREDVQENRQDFAEGQQDDRQDAADDRQEDRQDFVDDNN